MQEMSIETEQGNQSPLDFLVDLKEFLRAKVENGDLKAYSIAIPSEITYDIFDASAMHDTFAVKIKCPDCLSPRYSEDPDDKEKLTCLTCGRIYAKPTC